MYTSSARPKSPTLITNLSSILNNDQMLESIGSKCRDGTDISYFQGAETSITVTNPEIWAIIAASERADSQVMTH